MTKINFSLKQARLWVVAIGVGLYGTTGFSAVAASPVQRSFATPQDAVQSVLSACRWNSTRSLLKIFGPEGKDIVESGDTREDRQARKDFVRLVKEKLQVVPDPSNADKVTLSIGNADWPFPVPLVRADGKWHFDSTEGSQEIIARRIGGNELNAIEICRGYVEAQNQYAETHQKNGLPEYAQKIVSSPGQQDGLYWPASTSTSTPVCPVPPDFAKSAEGIASDQQEPYQGYFFRVLKAQGPDARGGAVSYVSKDSMIGGFGLIARPAEYGVSGIKTLIVNNDGTVYEKDLGPDTAKAAQAITEFNPDKSWQPVSEP